jgi:hypothetical protein
MKTLALDPGLQTGWARCDGKCGVLDYRASLWGEASAHFSGWLADQIALDGVVFIAYEAVIVRHAGTALALGITWDAHRIAHLHEISVPRSCTPQQRMKAIGVKMPKGSTTLQGKKAVLAWAQAAGWPATTFHEADAAAVLHWARGAV